MTSIYMILKHVYGELLLRQIKSENQEYILVFSYKLNQFHLCKCSMFFHVFSMSLKISMTHNQTKTCFVTGDRENRKTAVRLQRLGPLLLGSAHPWSRLLFLVFCPRQSASLFSHPPPPDKSQEPCFRARSTVFVRVVHPLTIGHTAYLPSIRPPHKEVAAQGKKQTD